ncbi:MAG TPA: outer membrane beta-barrel protein, partial [Saprospiraceae bacterium]|nr:outer membrane beta-barrel protein [Saprospiraceae bacterium]
GTSNFGINRSALFTLNGDIFTETLDEDKKGALYAQLGFHTRGSALRYYSNFYDFNTNVKYKFQNIVLELGAKKSLEISEKLSTYFILGIRGEYTVGNNLGSVTSFGELVSPDYIRKFNYGVTFGGGFEQVVSELSNIFVEFSIQPDLSFQYEQFPIENIRNPWVPNERINLPLTQVRNLSIEAKVGIKFLRKVIYID